MKYKIEIVIEGDDQLKNDLEKGFVEAGIRKDAFPEETILDFKFTPLPE